MKRIRIEVAPCTGEWKVSRTESDLRVFCHTQAEGIEVAQEWAHDLVKLGRTVTLKIKRRDGTIREERTYPRSSDPRRTKG